MGNSTSFPDWCLELATVTGGSFHRTLSLLFFFPNRFRVSNIECEGLHRWFNGAGMRPWKPQLRSFSQGLWWLEGSHHGARLWTENRATVEFVDASWSEAPEIPSFGNVMMWLGRDCLRKAPPSKTRLELQNPFSFAGEVPLYLSLRLRCALLNQYWARPPTKRSSIPQTSITIISQLHLFHSPYGTVLQGIIFCNHRPHFINPAHNISQCPPRPIRSPPLRLPRPPPRLLRRRMLARRLPPLARRRSAPRRGRRLTPPTFTRVCYSPVNLQTRR